MKKAPGTKPGSLASSQKSDRASSEATEQDLVVDSGSTDHIVVNKNWFKSIREIDTTVTNPDGGNTKVLGIGEVEVLARDVEGCTKPLILKKEKQNSRLQEKENFSFCPRPQKKNTTLLT